MGFKLTFFKLNDYFLQLVGIFGRYNALLKIRRGFLFFKGRTLKRTIFKYLRFHLDNKIKDVIMQGHVNVEGRINNFWIKDKQKIKSISSFFKHFKFYKSWRPFSYLYKKYKIYFNWGDREIFHRYPIYRRKYTISFYYPRFQDYRHLFKNQIKHQHLFRWLFKLKYKQLVQQFKKAALKTKRVFELIYLNFYEMRIDVLIYRLNFAWSIKQAGQWVNRSFFKVNWKIINWRNYHVIIGDIIYPIDNLRFSKLYKQSWIKKKLKIISSYSSVNNKTKDNKFKHLKKSHNIIKIVQDHYLNLRLFYRYIQGDQYPSYLIFQERIPAGLIWTMPDPTKVRHHSYFSIQYITLSLNMYS